MEARRTLIFRLLYPLHMSKAMSEVKAAAVQFSCCDNVERNIERAEALVRRAAAQGAQVILLQELFSSVYFPIDQTDCSDLAVSFNDDDNQVNDVLSPSLSYVEKFRKLAEELKVVLPISCYERCQYVPSHPFTPAAYFE